MMLDKIMWAGKPLAYIIKSEAMPAKTIFLTPPEFKQQVGFVVYSTGEEIARHKHLSLKRNLIGTSEVLIVKKGRCLADIYNENDELVDTRELQNGDVLLMVNGGHGFRMLENTVFLEIKQGPYLGLEEKERF